MTGDPLPLLNVATKAVGIPPEPHSIVKPLAARNCASAHEEFHSASEGSANSQMRSFRPRIFSDWRSIQDSAMSLVFESAARVVGAS